MNVSANKQEPRTHDNTVATHTHTHNSPRWIIYLRFPGCFTHGARLRNARLFVFCQPCSMCWSQIVVCRMHHLDKNTPHTSYQTQNTQSNNTMWSFMCTMCGFAGEKHAHASSDAHTQLLPHTLQFALHTSYVVCLCAVLPCIAYILCTVCDFVRWSMRSIRSRCALLHPIARRLLPCLIDFACLSSSAESSHTCRKPSHPPRPSPHQPSTAHRT